MSDIESNPRPNRIGFLLVDDFALISYASVIEPFRAANLLSGRELYSWSHYSANGGSVAASNGIRIEADGPIAGADRLDLLFVFAGGNPARFDDAATFAALRRLARTDVILAGVSGGPFLLARAGLLESHRCTIHWEHEPSFREVFPHIALERGLFVVDRGRLTCAGGIAGLDLATHLIERMHGARLASAVGEWFLRTEERKGSGAQRASIRTRYRVAHPGLVRALALVETNLSEPLSRPALAASAGVTVRQLERLFRKQMGRTIGEHYLQVRLQAAMRLLKETTLSRIEISIACGFVSATHFSRAFKRYFSMTPLAARHLPAARGQNRADK